MCRACTISSHSVYGKLCGQWIKKKKDNALSLLPLPCFHLYLQLKVIQCEISGIHGGSKFLENSIFPSWCLKLLWIPLSFLYLWLSHLTSQASWLIHCVCQAKLIHCSKWFDEGSVHKSLRTNVRLMANDNRIQLKTRQWVFSRSEEWVSHCRQCLRKNVL